MIYDYILATGDESISGCDSADLGTNRINEINKTAPQGAGTFYFDSSMITGDRDTLVTLNGQRLFQEAPATGQATNQIVYKIFSGDYFTKANAVNLVEKATLFFVSDSFTKPASDVSYEKFSGKYFIGTGMMSGSGIGNSLGSGISGTYPTASFDDFHYFLNGVKVYSGVGVSGVMEAGATTFVPDFVDGQGLVTTENAASFKATAYTKRTRINEVTGVAPDVFGSSFIEKQTELYVNGVKEHPSCYLELYSGVSSIETGVSAKVGGFGPTTAYKNLQL